MTIALHRNRMRADLPRRVQKSTEWAKSGLPAVFSWISSASAMARSGRSGRASPIQPPQVFRSERRKDDFVHDSARLADRFELADQRMGGIDLIIPVSPDQHQMLHVRLVKQMLQQVQRCQVEPLQIVEDSASGCSGRANTERKALEDS